MERLPLELLVLIGEHVQRSSDSQSTLHMLSLCCRNFYNVFQPMIYHSITAAYPMSAEFIRFIMRLWRQPELASQVRRLEMCWSACDQQKLDEVAINKLKEDTDLASFIQDALNEMFTPEEEDMRNEWEEHLSFEYLCGEAWLGLLLLRTNHLQTIEFQHENTELMSTILHKAATRQHPFHKTPLFPNLQEVLGNVAWGASWIDSGFLTPFFYFPNVRRIYCSAIGERRDDENQMLDESYRSSQVREIIVDEAYWCRGMVDWLITCTKLERVSIKIEVQADEYEICDNEKFDASLYRALLLPSAATLKSLRICYGEWYRDQLEDGDIHDAPFGTFRDFVVLEDILVRHSHLKDTQPLVEILPVSLKRLEIIDLMATDDQVQLMSELSDLVHQGSCENLEELVLRLDLEDEDVPADALRSLELECEARGILLKIEAPEDY
ncbi:hypothetical protein N7452_003266 [Penicillium brevicompactum]|uniref:F-box domain-containing protein n=1 Tax=Penicillium brevicompactum TaxID=5074 RepID=A0A9W9UJT8_PENBR|nr:hypothetical protein N7452_003266 [Penicillium brevicompactum]